MEINNRESRDDMHDQDGGSGGSKDEESKYFGKHFIQEPKFTVRELEQWRAAWLHKYSPASTQQGTLEQMQRASDIQRVVPLHTSQQQEKEAQKREREMDEGEFARKTKEQAEKERERQEREQMKQLQEQLHRAQQGRPRTFVETLAPVLAGHSGNQAVNSLSRMGVAIVGGMPGWVAQTFLGSWAKYSYATEKQNLAYLDRELDELRAMMTDKNSNDPQQRLGWEDRWHKWKEAQGPQSYRMHFRDIAEAARWIEAERNRQFREQLHKRDITGSIVDSLNSVLSNIKYHVNYLGVEGWRVPDMRALLRDIFKELVAKPFFGSASSGVHALQLAQRPESENLVKMLRELQITPHALADIIHAMPREQQVNVIDALNDEELLDVITSHGDYDAPTSGSALAILSSAFARGLMQVHQTQNMIATQDVNMQNSLYNYAEVMQNFARPRSSVQGPSWMEVRAEEQMAPGDLLARHFAREQHARNMREFQQAHAQQMNLLFAHLGFKFASELREYKEPALAETRLAQDQTQVPDAQTKAQETQPGAIEQQRIQLPTSGQEHVVVNMETGVDLPAVEAKQQGMLETGPTGAPATQMQKDAGASEVIEKTSALPRVWKTEGADKATGTDPERAVERWRALTTESPNTLVSHMVRGWDGRVQTSATNVEMENEGREFAENPQSEQFMRGVANLGSVVWAMIKGLPMGLVKTPGFGRPRRFAYDSEHLAHLHGLVSNVFAERNKELERMSVGERAKYVGKQFKHVGTSVQQFFTRDVQPIVAGAVTNAYEVVQKGVTEEYPSANKQFYDFMSARAFDLSEAYYASQANGRRRASVAEEKERIERSREISSDLAEYYSLADRIMYNLKEWLYEHDTQMLYEDARRLHTTFDLGEVLEICQRTAQRQSFEKISFLQNPNYALEQRWLLEKCDVRLKELGSQVALTQPEGMPLTQETSDSVGLIADLQSTASRFSLLDAVANVPAKYFNNTHTPFTDSDSYLLDFDKERGDEGTNLNLQAFNMQPEAEQDVLNPTLDSQLGMEEAEREKRVGEKRRSDADDFKRLVEQRMRNEVFTPAFYRWRAKNIKSTKDLLDLSNWFGYDEPTDREWYKGKIYEFPNERVHEEAKKFAERAGHEWRKSWSYEKNYEKKTAAKHSYVGAGENGRAKCGWCGRGVDRMKPEEVLVHNKNPEDFTCANCFHDHNEQTARRVTKRNAKFMPLSASEPHKEMLTQMGNARRVREERQPNSEERYFARRKPNMRMLRAARTGVVVRQGGAWNRKDSEDLADLLGHNEHAKERMNTMAKVNLSGMISRLLAEKKNMPKRPFNFEHLTSHAGTVHQIETNPKFLEHYTV